MSLIDIYELKEMFADAKSAAFIGNSTSVLSWDNGELIDSYDIVIRFNRAYTKGIEDKVGKRTTILVSNERNNIARSPAPSSALNPKCIVVFTPPKANKNLSKLKEWIGDIPYCISLGPDIVANNTGIRTRTLTMGTYALFTFLRFFQFEKIFITGFTMLGASVGGDGAYYYKEKKPFKSIYHDTDQEATIFSAILGQFQGELIMTEEVNILYNQFYLGKNDLHKKLSLTQRIFYYTSRRFIRFGYFLRRIVEKDQWLYRNN